MASMFRVLAFCAALAAAALCSQPVAAAAPSSVELPVYTDREPSPWTFVVPVPSGWTPVTEPGSPVAALTRRYARGCELFVQVLGEPGRGSFPLARALKRVRRAERGQRFVDAGGPRFVVNSRLAQVGGLAFGGGATGPGGFAVLRFRGWGDAPDLALTAQGRTEGTGCFSVSLRRAPELVAVLLRQIAAGTGLRYA